MSLAGPNAIIEVLSPLSGFVWPLSETPDQAFAQGSLGDGVAIDPVVGEVRAPFAGTILSLPASRHAVIVRHASGVEILVHVGVDTVGLDGEGFDALVSLGQQVEAGTRLLAFDLDRVARHGLSLISPVVVANPEAFDVVDRVEGRAVRAGEVVMRLQARSQTSLADPANPQPPLHAGSVTVGLAQGLHARPAAALVRLARRESLTGTLSVKGQAASLASLASLMALGVKPGDRVAYQVQGSGQAVSALCDFLASPFEGAEATHAPVLISDAPQPRDDKVLRGVCGAPGLALGAVFPFRLPEIAVNETGIGAEHEAERLQQALALATAKRAETLPSGIAGEIARAHLGLIEDEALQGQAFALVAAGKSAGFAWRAAITDFVRRFEASPQARLRERISDLRDVERRVLSALPGHVPPRLAPPPAGAILIADDLSPSQFGDMAVEHLAGICLVRSGPTAHVAMLAAARGVPLLVAGGEALLGLPQDALVILDATRGELHLHPTPEAQARLRDEMMAQAEGSRHALDQAKAPAFLTDGTQIEVFANLGGVTEAKAALSLGAEGCGLLRTEFLFMDRTSPPTEAEQRADYQQILDDLDGRPLVIRTLDPGADKPIAFLPLGSAQNPALGLRGVRISLRRPDLLAAQLRAVLSLSPRQAVQVMIPMVTDEGEVRAVRRALAAAAAELGVSPDIQIGLMIETPSAVLLARRLVAEVNFVSIGTNDLAQYVLAMDRTHPDLAAAADALHPAVLRAIQMTCLATQGTACAVSVCGGLASDLIAVPLLIGLGVQRLSCVPAVIPKVKQLIRTLSQEACLTLAEAALACQDAEAVRGLVRAHLASQGVEGWGQ